MDQRRLATAFLLTAKPLKRGRCGRERHGRLAGRHHGFGLSSIVRLYHARRARAITE